MPPPDDESPAAPLFTRRALVLWPVTFAAVLFVAHKLVLFTFRFVDFDCPPHWPLSIFNTRGPTGQNIAFAVATVGVAFLAVRRLSKTGYQWGEVAAFGLLLVLLSNAIQGVPKGFANPIAGGISGQQYYHDALAVHDAGAFLRDFHALQPNLLTHARTHPPGAVLLFYGMRRAGLTPSAMAVVVAVFATLLSAWAMPRFVSGLLPGTDRRFAGYATFLYLLLPAVQIYYCATLDALVAAILLAAVAAWVSSHRGVWFAGLCVALASFLTFGFVWVLPVLLALDGCRGRGVARTASVVVALAAIYGTLHAICGFDYVMALRTASRLENPMGYRLIAEPISFAFTRLEDVSEITVFFGPFLLALLVRGFSRLRRAEPLGFAAFVAAVGTQVGLFLAGAYHTGETARACMFVYPFLLLPTLPLLASAKENERSLVLGLVMAQTVGMQIIGNFFW